MNSSGPSRMRTAALRRPITVHNVPFGGKLYRLDVKGGKAAATPE